MNKVENYIDVQIMGEHLVLLPEAVIYHPAKELLLIADLHLGKAEHFRKNGIAIPGPLSQKDTNILDTLISTYLPKKIIFLGDLFHSEFNDSWHLLDEIITKFSEIEFHLIVGNHDILDDKHYEKLKLSYQYHIGDILCTHEPIPVPISGKYNLCGHIHPGVRLRGKGRQNLRLPCFYFGVEMGIMPAFGTFTGLYTVSPITGDQVYVIADGMVSQVC